MSQMMSSRNRVVLIAGMLVAVAMGSGALMFSRQTSAQAARADFNGTYEIRAGARSEEETANAASIANATRRMDPAIARHWRGMLEIVAMPQKRVQIAKTAQEISVATGGRTALISPASGATREVADGSTVKQQVVGNALVKRITSSAFLGKELNVPLQHVSSYQLSSDGRTLTLLTSIEGGLLPQAVQLRYTYDRVD